MSGDRPVTVVIPAHGHPDRVERLLAALAVQAAGGRPLPVIVSDDASPVRLDEALRQPRPPELALEIVRSESNGGPGAARNRGLERARTPWVAFLDSDELPGPGWLARLEAIATAADAPDGVEGRIDSGGERPTPFTHVAESPEVGALQGAGNIAFRTETLGALGGFDERYYDPRLRLHFREDAELFFRIQALGLRVPYDALLLVHHPPQPASFASPLRDARRYYFDALLEREHPGELHAFNQRRRLGPVSLRRARHLAALGHVTGVAGGLAALALGRRTAAACGGALALATWGGNAAALVWRRRVPRRDVLPVAVVALALPWVYALFYYRGAVRFRRLPRL